MPTRSFSKADSAPLGRLRLLGLAAMREAGGDRWPTLLGRIRTIAETAMRERLGAGGAFLQVDDVTYVVWLPAAPLDEAQFFANTLSESIRSAVRAELEIATFYVSTIVVSIDPAQAAAARADLPTLAAKLEAAAWERIEAEKADAQQARERSTLLKLGYEPIQPPTAKPARIEYDTADVDNVLAGMGDDEIDALPFGVIKVNRYGTILAFNLAEGRMSGLDPKRLIGKNFFRDIAPCTNRPEFLGRFATGVKKGELDVTFDYLFDFQMRPTRVSVHLKKSYHDDTYWILTRYAVEP